MQKERDNAANFVDFMCKEDCAFSSVSKKLGTFVAVLFYLREFEKWLKKNAANTEEKTGTSPNTGSTQAGVPDRARA